MSQFWTGCLIGTLATTVVLIFVVPGVAYLLTDKAATS